MQFGNLVQATALNVGSASNPDERISLQSVNLGPMNLGHPGAMAGASLQTSRSPPTTGYATSMTANTWDSSGKLPPPSTPGWSTWS